MTKEYIFDFERLDVYKKAVSFTNNIFRLTKVFSQDARFSLGDQFRRAALSICNNIAEGSGKGTKGAKRQYYAIALDSARECIPIITIALEQKEIEQKEADTLREECIIMCRMLFKLVSSVH